MIFARRALQRRLNELRISLGNDTVASFVARLNVPGRDRLAAVWEVAILHALSKLGEVENEVELTSGRRPDIKFDSNDISFTADITTVSDEGLDGQNPIDEFTSLIEKAKNKLGFPIGGLDVRAGYSEANLSGGKKFSLRLPERKHLNKFVQNQIVPEIRRLMDSGPPPYVINVLDEDHDVTITIDPQKAPYNSAHYISYNVPLVKNTNPLYAALRSKGKQIRAAEGIRGIIVADGDCTALRGGHVSQGQVTARQIVEDYLRQNTSVHFVCLMTAREKQDVWGSLASRVRSLDAEIICPTGQPLLSRLETLFQAVAAVMPAVIMMPNNAALRAREHGFGWGFHGGYQLSNTIKISSREVMDLLAGELSQERRAKLLGRHGSPFLAKLKQGRLPTAISVIKGTEDDPDDWLEFEFGEPDPAIQPFK